MIDRIDVENDPINWVDPWGLATDQHGMGPLSSNDGKIKDALDILNKGKDSGDAGKILTVKSSASYVLQKIAFHVPTTSRN